MVPPTATAADLLQAAVACHHAGRLGDARKLYERLLRKDPKDPNALNLMGVLLASTGELARGVQLLRRALAVWPDFPDALANLGKALLDSNQPEAARVACERALRLAPDDPETLNNLGNALLALGRPEDAQPCYRRATGIRPAYHEALMNEGLALLALGRLGEGWPLYEHRWRLGKMERTQPEGVPRWTGVEPLAGRNILLQAEQGLGDTVQFCRYALPVAARGASVVLEVQPPLVRLLRSLGEDRALPGSAPAIRVIAQGERRPAVDFHAPLMSLPGAFGTALATIPADIPYLRPDPARVQAWRERLSVHPAPRIGLVWAGNPRTGDPEANSVDQRRSMKLAAFTGLGDASFVSLQKGEPAREARRPPPGLRLLDWTAELGDFADTAALAGALDLVVGVDTSVVHVAGAIGAPVWVLNRHDRCWRWLLDRDDTPWYPSMRLFTQPRPGDWHSVLSELRTALAGLGAHDGTTGRRLGGRS